MAYTVLRHRVEDYSRWKPVFDKHGSTRGKAGQIGGQLFRSLDNPNDIVILFEWETKEDATSFFEFEDLRKTTQNAGVISKPKIYFLEKIEDLTV